MKHISPSILMVSVGKFPTVGRKNSHRVFLFFYLLRSPRHIGFRRCCIVLVDWLIGERVGGRVPNLSVKAAFFHLDNEAMLYKLPYRLVRRFGVHVDTLPSGSHAHIYAVLPAAIQRSKLDQQSARVTTHCAVSR